MAINAPSLFRVAQGAASVPRYGPVAMPQTQGFMGGGNMPMVYGYDGTPLNAEDWVNAPPGAPQPGGNAPDVGGATPDDYFISALAADRGLTFDEADAIWSSMGEDDKNLVRSALRRDLSPGGGGGSGDGAAYAQIAQRAAEFKEQMAFDRERALQEDKQARWTAEMNRQQALQDFYAQRDQAKVARKQMFNDAATAAIGAHQAGLGQARIPGIEKWRMDGGAASDQIINNAPIVGFNPSLTYGEQMEGPADLPEPNMPGVNF